MPLTPGDSLLQRLWLQLDEAFTGDAEGLTTARRVAQAAVHELRQAGATAESIATAAVDAVAPEFREAEQAVTAAEDRLWADG
jgi:hypothetical protein